MKNKHLFRKATNNNISDIIDELIAEIEELEDINNNLESEIEELKDQIDDLKAELK